MEIHLRPFSWVQHVSEDPSSTIMQLGVQCTLMKRRDLRLSDGTDVRELNIHLSILDTETGVDFAKRRLVNHETAIGTLEYHSDVVRGGVSGRFLLKPLAFTELWEQVRCGGYIDCTISLDVEPISGSGEDWVWDISSTSDGDLPPHLFIEAAYVEFTRKPPPAPEPAPAPPVKRSAWFRRR